MFVGINHTQTYSVCLMVLGKAVCFITYYIMDGLLDLLSSSNVGCYWGGHFAGAVCYADDVVLLAPSASALLRMLSICESFAISHWLVFNMDKTQLICFRTQSSVKKLPMILFTNTLS